MLELSKIKFEVDTTALLEAKKRIDELAAAQERLNRSGGAVGGNGGSGGGRGGGSGGGLKGMERVLERQATKMQVLRGEVVKLSDDTSKLDRAFTSGQAGMLASAKLAGATKEQFEKLAASFTDLNKLMGVNPFDKSSSGVNSLKKEVEELRAVNKLASEGVKLTTQEIRNLSRDLDAAKQSFDNNQLSLQEYNAKVADIRAETVRLSAEKANLQQASKLLEQQVKAEATAQQRLEKAQQQVAAEMQRVDTLLSELNREHSNGTMLSEKHAASIAKFSNQLKAAGISGTQATAQLEQYRNKMQQIEAIDNKRAKNRLANALAPQISDVAVSVAGGMPLYLIAMQQGLQIRDLIGQSGVAAAELQGVMRNAMKNMVISIGGTIAALSQLAFGGLADAGAAAVNFSTKIAGVNGLLEKQKLSLEASANAGNKLSAALIGIGRAAGIAAVAIAATGIGALVIAAGAAAAAFVQLIGANNNLARELAVTGNVFGVTSASSLQYVEGLTKVGATTREAIGIIGEMSKAGNLSREQIDLVGKAAIEMERATGVAISETVKKFSEFAKDPVKSLSALQIQTGAVRPEIIKLADELVKQGNAAGASSLAIEELARVNGEQAAMMIQNLHPLTVAWQDFKNAVSDGWTWLGSAINRAMNTLPEVEKIREEMELLQDASGANGVLAQVRARALDKVGGDDEYIRVRLEGLRNELRLIEANDMAQIKRSQDAAKAEKDRVKAEDIRSKSLTKEQQQLAARNKLLEDYDFLMKRGTPMSGQAYAERWQKEVVDPFKEKKDPAATKAESYENRVMRQLTNNTIAADNASKDLTKTQILLLEIEKQREFIAASPALKKRIRDAAEKSIASEQEAAAIKKVTEAEEFRLEVLGLSQGLGKQYYEQIAALEKHAKAAGWSKEQVDEMTKALFNQTPVVKEYNKSIEESAKFAEKLAQDSAKYAEESASIQVEIAKQNKDSEFRLSLLGKTTEEQRALTIEHQRSIAILDVEAKLQAKILDIRKKIDDATARGLGFSQYKSLIEAEVQAREDAAAQIEAINRGVAVTFAEDMRKEFDAMRDGIADSITTALFEGGKAGSQKLRTLIVNELKKPVVLMVQAVVNTLLGSILGGGSASAAVGGGSSGNLISNLSSAYSNYKSLASGTVGASIFGSSAAYASGLGLSSAAAGSQAAMLAAQTGSFGAAGLSLTAQAAGTASTAAASAASAATTASSALAAAGPYILAAVALAASWKSLFGRKLKDAGVEGTFGGDSGFTGNTYQFYEGGLFRSDKTTTGAMDAGMQQGLAGQFRALQLASVGMATTLGLGTEAIENFTADVKISFNGLKEEEIQKKLQEEFDKLADSMASALPGIADYTRAGETSSQTLGRLATSLQTANQAFDMLGNTLYASSLAGADMASQLIEAFGGIEQFGSATNAYFDAFYTEQEKLNVKTRQLTNSFANLGLELPSTIAGYRSLVDSQDLTTETGRRLYTALIQLSPAFAEVANAVKDVTKSISKEVLKMASDRNIANGLKTYEQWKDGLTNALSVLEDAVSKEIQKLEDDTANAIKLLEDSADAEKQRLAGIQEETSKIVDNLQRVFDVLKQNTDELYSSVDTTLQNQALQGRQFIQQALMQARVGGGLPDADELQRAIGMSREGLSATRFASKVDQDRQTLLLAAELSELQKYAGDQLTDAQQQLQVMENQLKSIDSLLEIQRNQLQSDLDTKRNELNAMLDLQRKQVDAALGNVNATMSLTAAMQNLANALGVKSPIEDAIAPIISAMKSGNITSNDAASSLASLGVNLTAGATTSVQGNSIYQSSGGAAAIMDTTNAAQSTINDLTGESYLVSDVISYVNSRLAANDPLSIYREAINRGISSGDLDNIMGWPSGTSNDWAVGQGLPSFAVGTNYVPRDMVAQIHEGEAIVPKKYNPYNPQNESQSAEMIKSLIEEVQMLRAETRAVAANTAKTSRILDDVTQDGDTLKVEVV